jgi:acetyl esterase
MISRRIIYILQGIGKETTCVLCFFLLCVSELVGQASDSIPKATPYRILDKDTLNAYVFKPASKHGDHPAILLFHGGAWKIGEAAWTFQRAREFAEKGMVAISIEYRLANNGMSPVDGVEDACFAFAWARRHAKGLGIDVKRVAGYGVSAGGHLVAAAALLPSVKGVKIQDVSRPNALLLFSPALNLAHDGYFVSIMAGKGNPTDYSPSAFVGKTLPPTLIIQGERDSLVFAVDAETFRDLAVKAHARCELKIYPAVGHLLSRNLNIQSNDFDPDPADVADAHQREVKFLESLGYLSR